MKRNVTGKTAVLLTALLFVSQLLAGCGGSAPQAGQEAAGKTGAAQETAAEAQAARPETALELFELYQEKYENNYHFTGHMDMTVGMKLNTAAASEEGEEVTEGAGQDSTMSLTIPIQIGYDMDVLDKLSHGTMTMEMSMFGEAMNVEAEMYGDVSGDEPLVYTKTVSSEEDAESAEWTKSASDSSLMIPTDDEASRKIMEKAQMTYEEGTGYLVTIDTSTFMDNGSAGDLFSEMSESSGLDPEALAAALADSVVTYTFDEDYKLTSIRMDSFSFTMTDDGTQFGTPADISLSMEYQMDLTDYGTVTEEMVKVPEDIAASAVESETED